MNKELSKPFGPEVIHEKRGQGGRMMPYVSHGSVTKRLNDAAPDWTATMIERYVQEVNGALHCLGGVMQMTIGGVMREEAGGPARLTTLADDLKNTYSDCLKRCAMRFGVALDLWESAEENDEDAQDSPGATERGNAGNDTPPTPATSQRATGQPPHLPVINVAWRMVSEGKDVATVWARVSKSRATATDTEWADITKEWKKIKAEIERRDAAIDARQPVGVDS